MTTEPTIPHAPTGIAALQADTFDPDDGPWSVHGVAMAPGVTLGASGTPRYWPPETLEAAAELLVGRPIVKNFHDLTGQAPADDVIGVITHATYVDDVGIVYEGEISDAEIAAKVANGYLDVSTVPFIAEETYDSDHDAQRVEQIAGFRDIAVVAEGASHGNSIAIGTNPAVAAMARHPEAAVEALGASAARITDGVDVDGSPDPSGRQPLSADVDASVLANSIEGLADRVDALEDHERANASEFFDFYDEHGVPDDAWGALIRHVAGLHDLTRGLMHYTMSHDQDMMDHEPDADDEEDADLEDNPSDDDEEEYEANTGGGAPAWANDADRLRLPNPNENEGITRLLAESLGPERAHPRDVRSIKDDPLPVDISRNELAKDVLDIPDEDDAVDPDDPVTRAAIGADESDDEPTPTIKDDAAALDPDSATAKQALGIDEPDDTLDDDLEPVAAAVVADDDAPDPDPVRDPAEDVDLDSDVGRSVMGDEPDDAPDPDLEPVASTVAGQSADPADDTPDPDPVRDPAEDVPLDSDLAHRALGTEPIADDAGSPETSADRWTYTRTPTDDVPDDPTGIRAALDDEDDALDDPINRQAVGIDDENHQTEDTDDDADE